MRSHPELRPALATIGMCLPLALGLAACSSEPQIGGPEVAKTLLANDAEVHVIYVPSSTSRELNNTDAFMFTREEVQSFESQLATGDESVVRPIIGAFSKATYGRYTPGSVTITKAPDLTLEEGCVPYGDSDFYDDLEQHIQSYLQPNMLNVVALGAFTCQMIEASAQPVVNAAASAPAGFTPANKHSVLTRGFFGTEFSDATVHEAGHFFGLPHAGKAKCDDPSTLRECTVDVSGDQNSIMSYAQYKPLGAVNFGRYTAPELYRLGLLRPNEIMTETESQVVNLYSMTSLNGIKLIVGGSEDERVYMSWENSVFTSYDPRCRDDAQAGSRTEVAPDAEACMRQKTNEGASLQVRFPLRTSDAFLRGTTDTDSLVMLDTQPDSMHTSTRGESRDTFADGYTEAPALVYESERATYRLESTYRDAAVVSIATR